MLVHGVCRIINHISQWFKFLELVFGLEKGRL